MFLASFPLPWCEGGRQGVAWPVVRHACTHASLHPELSSATQCSTAAVAHLLSTMAATPHCALRTLVSPEALSFGQGQGQRQGARGKGQRRLPARQLAASSSTAKPSSGLSSGELAHGNFWGNAGKLPAQRPGPGPGLGPRAEAGARAVRAMAVAEAVAAAAPAADAFVLDVLQRIPETSPGAAPLFQRLRESSRAAAGAMKWPGRKDEAFRFTDVKPLQELALAFDAGTSAGDLDLSGLNLGVAEGCTLVTVDGVWQPQLSSGLEAAPSNLIVGPISQLSDDVVQSVVAPALGRISGGLDLFSQLNGAAATEVLVVVAREGVAPAYPIHVIHIATSAAGRVSSPRLLVVAQAGAEVEFVEEFVGAPCAPEAGQSQEGGGSPYWTNALAEITVAKGARVMHGVVQQQDKGAFHTKTTAVQQEEGSEYSLIEAQLGGRLSRHFLQMKQLGPDTRTNVSTFCLCGARQLHDLHSSLVLDFPRGVTRQLHKCIVSESTGHGVFDGNVQVNKYAQQTDAGQLTRSLLLAPRGTVNVKPNLQIVADDVKCTHGAAISDLDDEQLFYFQARGINAAAARSALVFSFAAEVVEMFPYGKLRKRLEQSLKDSLSAQGAMDSGVASELQGVDI